MFWWGNFFSITLHLSGTFKKEYVPALVKNQERLCGGNFYICVHEDQWQHHFESDNYQAVKNKTPEEIKRILIQQPFIKLACKFPLDQWNQMPGILEAAFSSMLQLIR